MIDSPLVELAVAALLQRVDAHQAYLRRADEVASSRLLAAQRTAEALAELAGRFAGTRGELLAAAVAAEELATREPAEGAHDLRDGYAEASRRIRDLRSGR